MTRKLFLVAMLPLLSVVGFSQQEMNLSLSDALKTAVERNLDIQLQRINVESRSISLDLIRAAFEPVITNFSQFNTEDREATTLTEGEAGASFTRETSIFNTTMRKPTDYGLTWNVDFNNSLFESNEAFALGKTYSSTLRLGFEQQLLKGFSLDGEILRNEQYVARGNLEVSRYDLKVQMTTVLQATEDAYWDLVFAIEQLKVNRQSLDLAKQLYDQNKIKIEVGTLAPIELVNTEATIATRESDVISAENRVRAAEDSLKKVMNLPPNDWYKTILPTDSLQIQEIQTDLEQDFEQAFRNRPELLKNEREKQNALLTYKLRRNERLPELKLGGSYTSTGTSSTAEDRQTGEILLVSDYNEALTKALYSEFPGWQVNLNLTWTPLNKQAKLNMAQARADLRQSELISEQTKINIMEEVRSAHRELNSNLKSIKANEKALKFREENLKAEVQKFQNGLSTNYLVAEAQKDLAEAESLVIQSKVNYLKALVSYYRALGQLTEKRNIALD